MYLAVSDVAVSAVLFHEEQKKQKPVFYTSRMLLDAETRYSTMEKLVLALVNTKRKLRHYFESHPISVITNFPIKQILSKPNLSGRLTKWVIDVGIYDIRYLPRAAKKGQVLADFLVEIQSFTQPPEQIMQTKDEQLPWILSSDGASNASGSGIGLVLEAPSGLRVEEALRLNFAATNNEAEYEALLYGLTLAQHLGVKLIKVRTDSKLIAEQVCLQYKFFSIHIPAWYISSMPPFCEY